MEALKEEVEYFTNQCYKEVRRVLMMDYDLAKDNFVDMGEMMMRIIHQVSSPNQLTIILTPDEYWLAGVLGFLYQPQRG